MAIVTIPTGMLFGPECGWGQLRYDSVDESEADGSSDVRVRGRPRWTCSLVPPQRLKQGVEAQKWESMLLSLKGRTNVLAAYDPVRPLPAGGAWAGSKSIAARVLEKVTGPSAWSVRTSSANSYYGGAAVEFRASSGSIAVALTSDPNAALIFESLDFAWVLDSGGADCHIYENGALQGSYGAWTDATVFSVASDGATVRYYKNGSLMRSVAGGGGSLYFSSSHYGVGAKVINPGFGPALSNLGTPWQPVMTTPDVTSNFGVDRIELLAASESTGRAFGEGDKIQIGTGFGTSELVRIKESGALSAAKKVIVVVEPPFRRFYDEGAVVTTEKPLAYFSSTADRVSWSYNGTGLLVKGYSFDGRERWR